MGQMGMKIVDMKHRTFCLRKMINRITLLLKMTKMMVMTTTMMMMIMKKKKKKRIM